VSDFKLKVIAETQTAERSLKQVGEIADKATKARSLDIKVPSLSGVTKTFQTLERDVKNAANTINTFYKVGKALPGNFGESVRAIENVGKGAAKSAIALNNNNTAAEIFSNTLKGATGAAGQLVTTLAKVGFATFAIKETVGLLQAAFTGFFNNTIGREVKLRETILKTQTTLASTNKVFKDGKEITDPYQKIVALTGAVNKNIESIRERSIALAGVTSGEVIEVFGIVASQIGQIGGGLKEAEDLAIQFAAALGTFGLPIYQARQEIGSILRGDIGIDSILAKSLQISSKDIAEAKTKAGGVVKFLEERLAAAVAGQRIAAEGFSGVVSNIKDLGELIGQNFGTGMLQPLLHSLTAVFETLFRIRKQIFDIAAKAGETVGRVGTLVVGLTAGRTGAGKGVDASAAASAAAGVANKAFTEIETVAQRTVGAISQVIAALQPTALILADAFRNIVEAFVQIKVGTFEALASALANIATAAGTVAPAFATIFNLYARFLNTPIVKYFAEVATVLALLKRAGLDAATSLLLFGKFVVSSVIPALGVFGTAAGAVVAGIAAIGLAIGKLVLVLAGLASALVTPAAAIPAVAAAFQALSASLTNVGNQAVGANTKLAGLSKGLTALGATAKAAGGAILASLGWVVAFQVGIAVVVDALGRYQRAQEDKKSSARAAEALRRLQTTYKDVGDSADSATKAARDFEQAIVNAQYDRNIDALEKVREKINQIRYELKPGIQSWGEFWAAASGEEMGKFEARAQSALAAGLAEEAKLKAQLSGVDAQRDRKLAEENVKLIANKKIDLSKEIAELERQQQNDLFQQRQTLAQKEVEIFRAAGELRIFQMEQANAKLIEGEEGASRTALEALNNYLSVRENGELEIEAAKKDIVIEVANLEKTIADYRFENEKKIAEIRKRSGENERAMADAQRQAAGQAPAAPGVSEGFRVGSTGRSSGPHLDIRGSDRESVVREAASIIKAWQGQNLPYITLPNANIDVKNMTDEAALLKALRKEQVAHDTTRNRRIGQSQGAIDIAVPSGTLVPTPASAPSWAGAGGWQATSQATGNRFLHGLKDSKASPPGAAPAAAPTPALQSLDVLAPATEAYAAAVRGVASAMERVRTLQAALTKAQTVAAFEAIAKAAFPQVQLEGYEDNLFTVQATYDAVAASAAGAFDPERAAITIDRTMKIAAANREVKQITDEIAKRPNITEKERSKLADDLAAKKKNYLADLAKEEAAKLRILAVQRATDFITQTQADTKAIYDNIEVLELRNRLRFEGVDPAVIAGAEALLLNERRMVEATKLLNEQLAIEYAERDRLQKLKATADAAALPALQKDLDDALAQIAKLEGQRAGVQATGFAQAGAINAQTAAETEPGAKIRAFIGDAKRELADLEAVAVRISQSIGDAVGNSLANGIMGLIEGTTTAKEVFANFLKSIGQILVQEGTKMIAMYIAIAIAKAIAGMSGGGIKGAGNAAGAKAFGGSGPTFNPGAFSMPKLAANGATFANGIAQFANGGAFTNSIVSSPTMFKFADGGTTRTGLMGEAGPEAIMPLKRGADGSLGVQANGLREAMGRPPGATSKAPVLNMKFETTSINGVEYVSRDQLESAMAVTRRQAAKDGASRGMNMTLDKIQNSPSTRARVGIR
jgi:lambda family phage tail tape measure protein